MNSKIKVELCDEVRNILTEKERKIILSLLQGRTVTDIAVATCRDIRTISTQKNSAYKKLNVKNDVSLIVKLLENRYARIAYPEHQ